jgi:dTMP kinase
MSHWTSQLAGRFLVFDGPDGSGKTTQFHRFGGYCREQGLSVCEVREPGGTHIGEQIRKVLLDPGNEGMSVCCEMLLYMASRAQLVSDVIRPALQRGELVLADRFISSTLAYQGYAGEFPVDEILRVATVAVGDSWPDHVIIFDVDEVTAAARMNPLLDRMELKGTAFQSKVRAAYLQQAEDDPGGHTVIDASPDVDVVFDSLLATAKSLAEVLTPVRSSP